MPVRVNYFWLTVGADSTTSVRYNLWDWQSLQPYSGPNQQFYQFCDALEVGSDGTVAPAAGFGLDHALTAWGSYMTNTYLPASALQSKFESIVHLIVD